MYTPPRTFRYHFCLDCLEIHYIEVFPGGREQCHGPEFDPHAIPGFYLKWTAGYLELRPLMPASGAAEPAQERQQAFDEALEARYEERTDCGGE